MPTMNDLLPQVASRQPVERLAADQISRFQRHFKSQGIPVHLTGLAAQWPALQRWTPEYFLTRFGDREVKLDGRVYTIADFLRDPQSAPQSEGPVPYLRQTKLRDVMPELLEELQPTPDHWRGSWLATSKIGPLTLPPAHEYEILMGRGGSSFPTIHYDALHLHAFVVQLYGRKKVALMAPSESDNLYPDPDWPNKSTVPINGTLDEYPLLENLTLYETELEPGDAIYVPSGWWHAVVNSEMSIAVTLNAADRYNWQSFSGDWLGGDRFSPPKRMVARAILGTAGVLYRLTDVRTPKR